MTSHRSRLCAALIDVPRSDYERTVAFWRDALPAEPSNAPNDPDYTSFGEPGPGVRFEVQAVDEPAARVHFDIETDDVDAEVARLTALGATEVAHIHTWTVMRDPVGTIFCVVRVQVPEAFEAHATTWTT